MSNLDRRPLVSICIPVLNEEENIENAYLKVKDIFDNLLPNYQFEIVITDNQSTDETWAIAKKIATSDARVKIARMAKNVGYQRSILTGFLISTGDCAIQLDCDLQDPPEMFVNMIKEWNEGADVVYGIRKRREEGVLITICRKIYYRLINAMTDDDLPSDAGDFRLISRRVIEILRQTNDRSPYIRGMVATMGFHQVGIPYDRLARTAGESKFRFRSLVQFASDAIISHSTLPLRIGGYIGIFVSSVAVVFLAAVLFARLYGADWPAGWTSLVFLILLNLALTCSLFGIFGLYLARVLRQGRDIPLSVLQDSVGIEDIPYSPYTRILDTSSHNRNHQILDHSKTK